MHGAGAHRSGATRHRGGTEPRDKGWLELHRWGTWGEAMDETGTDLPGPRFLRVAKEEGGTDQEAQNCEQRCDGMAQRARLVPVPSGDNDFKRM